MPDNKQTESKHKGMDVSGLRRSATGFALEREDLSDDPYVQFEDWVSYACETVPTDPNAVSIATVDSRNRPSIRTVSLKESLPSNSEPWSMKAVRPPGDDEGAGDGAENVESEPVPLLLPNGVRAIA